MPTDTSGQVTVIDLSAEVKKIWGPEWTKPELEYEFSNGRKFYRQTGDAAIYATSPDFGS
jgi:hypothetical protein